MSFINRNKQNVLSDSLKNKYKYNFKIKSGWRTLFIGYHNILFHPITLLLSYIDRNKSIPSIKMIMVFFLHDIGYAFESMDSIKAGYDKHPIYGAIISERILGYRCGQMCLEHSREFSKDGKVSELALYDKDSYRFHPLWLAVAQCFLSGELGTRDIGKIKEKILSWRKKASIFVDDTLNSSRLLLSLTDE